MKLASSNIFNPNPTGGGKLCVATGTRRVKSALACCKLTPGFRRAKPLTVSAAGYTAVVHLQEGPIKYLVAGLIGEVAGYDRSMFGNATPQPTLGRPGPAAIALCPGYSSSSGRLIGATSISTPSLERDCSHFCSVQICDRLKSTPSALIRPL